MKPLLNENMFDCLVFDVNAIIEDCRGKEDLFQEPSSPDTVAQCVHGPVLVIIRAVICSIVAVYQLHFLKRRMGRHKYDGLFIGWNRIQKGFALCIPVIESNL